MALIDIARWVLQAVHQDRRPDAEGTTYGLLVDLMIWSATLALPAVAPAVESALAVRMRSSESTLAIWPPEPDDAGWSCVVMATPWTVTGRVVRANGPISALIAALEVLDLLEDDLQYRCGDWALYGEEDDDTEDGGHTEGDLPATFEQVLVLNDGELLVSISRPYWDDERGWSVTVKAPDEGFRRVISSRGDSLDALLCTLRLLSGVVHRGDARVLLRPDLPPDSPMPRSGPHARSCRRT